MEDPWSCHFDLQGSQPRSRLVALPQDDNPFVARPGTASIQALDGHEHTCTCPVPGGDSLAG